MRMTSVALLASLLAACAVDDPASQSSTRPCRSSDGFITTDYQYDQAFHLAIETDHLVGAEDVVRELSITYAGDVEASFHEVTYPHNTSPSVHVSGADIGESFELDASGRVLGDVWSDSDPVTSETVVRTDAYTYAGDHLVRIDGDYSGSLQGQSVDSWQLLQTFEYPDAQTEIETSCLNGTCSKTTQIGGKLWTRLLSDGNADGSAEYVTDREYDKNGQVLVEERTKLDDGTVESRSETTRRDDGAPLQTVHTYGTHVQTITYEYCSP